MDETFSTPDRKRFFDSKPTFIKGLKHFNFPFLLLFFTFISFNVSAQDLYWVGGSGNWNNTTNWASTSGGQGGAGVPDNSTNAIFDQHSFNSHGQTVQISSSANCQALDMSGLAQYDIQLIGNQPSSELTVHGQFKLGSLNGFQVEKLHLRSDQPNTPIHTNGVVLNTELEFNGNGSWVLQSELVSTQLFLEKGELQANGHNIVTGTFASSGGASRSLILDPNSEFQIHNGANVADTLNFSFDPNGGTFVIDEDIPSSAIDLGGLDKVITGVRDNEATICNFPDCIKEIKVIPQDTALKNGFDLSCKDSCDGEFIVIVSDSSGCTNPGFSYTWFISSTHNSNDSLAWNVCDQSFIEVRVTNDSTGQFCDVRYNLEVPSKLRKLDDIKTQPSCPGFCDGEILYSPKGGVTPYDYLWTNGDTTNTADSLCAGNHDLRVTDDNGCEITDTLNLSEPPPITANLQTQDASCFGTCDGWAKVNPSGGNGSPYYFDWSTGSTQDSIGGLCAGNYSVTIYDQDSCSATFSVTINEPLQIQIDTTGHQDLLCYQDCIGSISVSVTDGTSPYSYEWYNAGTGNPISPQQDSSTVTGLCAGDYYVVVTDDNNCQETGDTITLTEPPELTADATGSDILCYGETTGSASVNVTGGTSPYDYDWFEVGAGSVGPNSSSISGLSAGDYYVEVTDSNNCTVISDTVTVTEPPELDASISDSDIPCYGECNGDASLSITGGVGDYSIDWYTSPADTLIGAPDSNFVDSLCAGDYYAVVNDTNNCIDTSSITSITQPPPLASNITSANVTCNGDCDGSANANPSGGVTPYTIDWYDGTGSSIGQSGNSATNLCPGDYFATVTDSNNCTHNTDTITITQPNALTTPLDITHVSCGGYGDGEITVNPSGGTAPYDYQWYDAGGTALDTTQTQTGLSPGDYYVVVSDDNGCIDTSVTATITEPNPLNIVTDSVNATCYQSCDGMAIADVSEGTTPYNYKWIDGNGDTLFTQTTDTASGLCAGLYSITIIDDNGCIEGPDSVSINQPTELDPSLTITDASCNGDCDGSVSVSMNGGTPGYSYNWYGAGSGSSVSGLCAGTDSVNIQDANNCDTTVVYTINEPNPLNLNLSTTDPSCSGICDGTASVSVSGGSSPYSYQWYDNGGNPIAGDTTNNVSGYCDGSFSVEVTDTNGCTISQAFTMTSPAVIGVTVDSSNESNCGTTCDGEVYITPSGGTSPYSYQWYDAASGSSTSDTIEDPTTLCSGDYYAMVTDDNGCQVQTDTVSVVNTVVVTAYASNTDATCFNTCDGTAQVDSVTGGAGPYEYFWINTATSDTVAQIPSISGLCTGTYALRARDTNLCNSLPVYVTVNSPSELNLETDSTALTCFGDNSGTAIVTPVGGTSPYSFQWDAATGNQTDSIATNLPADTFDVTVTDTNGCTNDTSVIVTQPPQLTASKGQVNVSCNGNSDGMAWVVASGGSVSGTYSYQWFDSSGNPIIGSTDDSLTNLPAGNYSVQIQDDSSCTISRNFTITEPNSLSATMVDSQNVLCNGDTNGTATVGVSGGTAPYNYNWNDPANQDSSTAIDLSPGSYAVTITDDNGCDTTLNVTITEPDPFFFTTDSTDVLCNSNCDGTATVTVDSGATSPFDYAWNDPFNQTNPTASNLCAGTYQVTLSDDNNCDTTTTVEVVEPTPLSITVTDTVNPACNDSCDGYISVNVSGGTVSGDYSYTWYDAQAGGPISPQQDSSTALNLCDSDYYLVATDDNGCTVTTDTLSLNEPAAMTASFNTTEATCGSCNGTAAVDVNNGVGPYTYDWSPSGGITGQGTDSISDACSGIYNLEVTDQVGCKQTFSFPLNELGSETLASDSLSVTCNGGSDGTGIVTIVGGCTNPPCNIDWFDGSGNNLGVSNDTITGLSSGVYYAEVTNGPGCSAFDSVFIPEPSPIDPNVVIQQHASCFNTCDGQASSSPSGGNGGYGYFWVEVSTGDTVSTSSSPVNLCGGDYMLTVQDSSNCDTTLSLTIDQPPQLDLSDMDSNMVDCYGNTNGTATVFPTGGSGGVSNYSYEWFDCSTSNPIGQSTQQATGLASGSYYVAVTDTNGCTANSACVTITQPNAINTSTNIIQHVACNGGNSGSGEVTVSGGITPYSYQWYTSGGNPVAGATDDTLTGSSAGTFIVEITDDNNCTTTDTLVINEPAALDPTLTINNVTCNGGNDGSMSVNVSGGVIPYDYEWYDSSGNLISTSNSIAGQPADTYTVIVGDGNNCDTTVVDSITQPTPINIPVAQNSGCYNVCDGSLVANPSGGNGGPFSYEWRDSLNNPIAGATNDSIGGLCAGDFIIEITDASGCTDTAHVTLSEASAITADTAVNNSTCGSCNGSATVNANGGAGNYSYNWSSDPNDTTQMAANLCSGVYTVTVTDANGCSENFQAAVSDQGAEDVTTDSTNVTCFNGSDGSITANFTCSDPACSIIWTNASTNDTINTGNTTVTGVSQGGYFSHVTNNSGCTSIEHVTVLDGDTIKDNNTIAHVTCNGSSDGEITVSPTGGSGPYSYNWTDGSGTNIGTASSVSGLSPDTYDVVITDNGTGCDTTYSYNINQPNSLVVDSFGVSNVGCNGDSTGSATAFASGGSSPYSYSWNDPNNQTTVTADSLPAGIWDVTVTDTNSCDTTVSVNITDPNAITTTFTINDVLCNGESNGAATVHASGGTPDYNFQWYNNSGVAIPGETDSTMSGLSTGTYLVQVSDSSGCSSGQVSVTINEPAPLTAMMEDPIDISCYGTCDGVASTAATGGTQFSYGYDYQWTDTSGTVIGSNNDSIMNLCSGTYFVEVTDSNGCIINADTTVSQPTQITADSAATPSNCGFSDGTASINNVNGGYGSYSYEWFDDNMVAIGEAASTADSLASGTYYCEVTDDSNCTRTFSVTVPVVNAPTINTDSILSASCNGTNDGAIYISISGSPVGPVSYNWNPVGGTTQDLTNAQGGIYTVEMRDSINCTVTMTDTIPEPTAITGTFNVTDATCGSCNGQVTVTPAGGISPYTYQWSTGETTASVSGMCAGVHAVEVTDSTGCSETINVTVNNLGAPIVDSVNTTASCFSNCNGTATVNISGGTPPYSYSWLDSGDTTSTRNNLCAGQYFVEVEDDSGCVTVANITIPQLDEIRDSAFITTANCGMCDGEIDLYPGPNPSTYNYQWFDSAGNPIPGDNNMFGLCSGIYTVAISDTTNGCYDTLTYSVGDAGGPQVTASVNVNASCNDTCDAEAIATVNGPTTDLTFEWFNASGTSTGQTSATATGLCEGNYTVEVVDTTTGCTSYSTLTISQPDRLQFNVPTVTNVSCNGNCDGNATVSFIGGTAPYNIQWGSGTSGATDTSLCSGNHSLTVTDGNGCTSSFSASVGEPDSISVTEDSLTQGTCYNVNDGSIGITINGGTPTYNINWSGPSGYSSTNEDLNNIYPGNYAIDITDSKGCTYSDTLEVDTAISVTATAYQDTVICENEVPVDIYGTGGTGNQWFTEDGSSLGTDDTLSIAPNTTTNYLFVANQSVCSDTDTVVITVNPTPNADAGNVSEIFTGQTVELGGIPTGPSGSTFSWQPDQWLSDTAASNPTLTPLQSGNYTYWVEVTSPLGCMGYDTLEVSVKPDVVFANGFSPNGDGVNDVWHINYIDQYPDAEVEVYNRWGELLFRSVGYEEPWDGTHNGKPVPVGTYYYIIDLNDDEIDPYTGPITIVR